MSENRNPSLQPNFTGRQSPWLHLAAEKPRLTNVTGTLKRILEYLLGWRSSLLFALVCAVVSTGITIVGTRLNGYTVDTFIARKDARMLGIVCLLMAGMYVVGVASSYVQSVLTIRAAQRTSAALRRDLFRRVAHLPPAYFDAHSSGDVMSRLTNDVDNINTAISQTTVQLFTGIVSVAGMLAAMLFLSPPLTLVCLITTPLTFFTTRIIARNVQRFFVEQQRELGRLNGYIEEMVSGQKILRLFSRETRVVEDFERINRRYVGDAFRAQAVSGIIGPCNNMVNNIAYLLVAVAGGFCVIRNIGDVTVGVVFSFLLYMRNFTNPINNILAMANSLQLALASAERVFETMDGQPECDADGASDIERIEGDIRFENVRFSYVPGKPVLRGADIVAEPGQTVAIVGPTGAGKTTIISLLTRFYDTDGGRIRIDGMPIEAITRRSLRRSVSLVLQDTFLFSDTIRENIRYGRIDAGDEEVVEAARQAHAHEFILQLPHGYDTVLTDNGQNLSQGQRQLLNIARSLLSRASVLILDEATSSVDTRTEQIIQSALLTLMQGKTSFVIAHRLSTIKNADKIVVIDGGRVVEQGTHESLLEKKGFYFRLYESQFKTGMPNEVPGG